LLESRNGDIWIGTQNGLTEKKGNTFIRYTENEGLINNIVKTICDDKYGNLWFGTEKGVSKFDGVSFTHFTENEGLISNYVTSVIEDKCGNIWFGTDLGASKYDGKSFRQFGIKEGLSNIKSITEDNNGYLWFATGGRGVKIYDGDSFTTITSKEGLSNNNILFITKDRSRNIWLSPYNSGVVKLKQSSFIYFPQFEDIGKGKVNSIIEDNKGNIWFAFGEGYLAKFDGESFMVITANEDQTHLIYTYMLKDKDGNIWFSNDDGLNKYNGSSVTLYYEKEVPDLSMIGFINCLYEDKKGNIWLGTWGKGLKKFDGENFTDFYRGLKFSPNEGITSILQDNNEDIWYGTIDGLLKYDGECITKYDIIEGLSGFIISSLFGDEAGNLWIGTQDGGVNKFDGNSFTYFTEKEGLSNNNVSSIIGDKKGNIWIGTKKGLSLLSRQGDSDYSITSFRTKDALKVLDFIEGSVCLDSRNRLWWGTGDIVTMLDLNTFELDKKPPVIQLNNIYLNQRYIDFRAFMSGIEEAKKSPSDSIIKGEMRGLKFSDVPPFYNYPMDLKLPHYLNNVTFNFSAIDWTAPQSIRYQYMVKGMDEEWNPLSTENKAEYRNIPSGKYIFMVKAISTANIWSETFEYPFTIHPPWWLQWWAYTFYVVILVLLVRYYIRYRIGRERIKAEIQIKQVEVDKMQELDHMKSRFFANISHEFRTPLTLILGPVEDFIRKKPKRIEISWDLLKIIHRNARRLHQLIDQLLDLSKLETGKLKLEVTQGDLTGFIRTLVLSFLSLAESKRINYEYDLQDMSDLCFYDEDKIEKIITNLISNALKFTPDRGSVMVTLGYSRDKDIASGLYAEIRVKDSGPGIPDDEKEKIFDRFYQVSNSDSRDYEGSGIGLALTKELVELYKGKIHVDSEVGQGSTFTVVLPVSRAHFREDEIVAVSEKPAKVKFIDDHEILIREAAEPGLKKDTVRESDKERPVILIVEDNMDLREYISGNLSSQYQILEAENGREGLDIAIECIPDLVISDLMMPEMDGVEMCDRLKKDTRTNHIPLIILTAKADRESKLESLETGADDYIIKPFDAEELQVRVKNLIEQRRKLREFYRKEFLADPAVHEIPLPENEFLDRFMDCLKKHLTESGFNVEQLGEELHLSRTQLYRKILALTDHTPGEFIRNFRLKMAARMFLEGHTNITKVLYTVGYNSPSHFTQSFRELFGINPSEYIKQKAKSTN
jgi:signal transduction histidine kinase/ligand-binding sensor domain-containing protein/DNA-binding response OmpR family regulator